MLARGTSIDGYWATDTGSGWWAWNGCSYCTDDTSCQCFYSDGTGGSGIFQVNINQYTTMNWAMELDFTTAAGVPSGADWQACYPASGEGWATDIGGSTLTIWTTKPRASFVRRRGETTRLTLEAGSLPGGGLYANYQGAGTMGQGIYGRLPSEVVSQVQFNGQINPAAPTPSPLPTPSPIPWAATATPTP